MSVKMENLTEFGEMKSEFQKIGCWISIRGGMKERGYTEHDLDLDIQLHESKNLLASFSKMKKWNRIFLGKYNIFLDVQIFDGQRKHIFDFDGRVPTFMKRPWERAVMTSDGKLLFKENTRKQPQH